MIVQSDVRSAATRIRDQVRTTPLVEADAAPFAPAARVWLKLEQLQHTGSFKLRGASNRILTAAEEGQLTEAGVVAASGGNAGLGVAHVASTLGVPARVYVPETTPAVKTTGLQNLGADVVATGQQYADAYDAARKHVADTGALFCHAYNQPEVSAGQGTLGQELLTQTQDALDTVLLAVGGGGLLAGVAAATEGRTRVVGVEPRSIPTLHTALTAQEPVEVPVSGVATDSLGASKLGEIAYTVATRAGVHSVLVEDDDIVSARAWLWRQYRLVVEHGTAAALAALFSGAYRPQPGERLAIVLCGANTDLHDLG